MKIYIVMGKTGEYSDRDEWPVISYEDHELAKEHVINATKRANELYDLEKDGYKKIPHKIMTYEELEAMNEYDKDMKMTYTGTSYFLSEVDLIKQQQEK